MLYFTSYALWNYFTTPFLLTQPGIDVSETWQRLQVRFPSTIPTHNAEQVFYFNEKGLLQRLDYITEVAGGGIASHYCFDHASFSGLVFPTLRRVISRTSTGPLISGRTRVLLLISDVLVL